MPRTDKVRIIEALPQVTHFRPKGSFAKSIKIDLSIDEFEAVRLADFLGYDHQASSEMMNVSRPTFSRILDRARKKIADFLVLGKELFITGGNVTVASPDENSGKKVITK